MSYVNRTPAAKRPGTLHPWAAVARAEEEKAAAEQAEQDAADAVFAAEVRALQAS